ncbi:DNA polymerase III, delta subunit [Marininema mesophilum]|uniref:DNA polymerase III subunit delta n=1 Tax=Marininema mesophilum TaxID=1048340 RepID=A0A1H2Y1X1_9BACL|nr:DNA polymerase III subunit delta [Marininema mesophilum]SDW98579.1 DNA polymerase III, delta subunit [Marininema mesophilum]
MDSKLARELKAGEIAPVYLFYGTETFLIDEGCAEVEKQALCGESSEWNRTVLDLEEVSIQDLVREAETPSFFGGRRVVIGKNAWFLTAIRVKEKVEHQPEELLRYVADPLMENVLILTVPAEKLDARKKVVKEMKKHVREVACQPLAPKALLAWVSARLQQAEARVHPQTVELLIQQVGGDLRLLAMEIDKLTTYVGKERTITPEIVNELVPRTLEQDVFKLVDRVSRRKIGEALAIFYDLVDNREEPIRILSLIIRQFRLMLQVKVLAEEGKVEREIATVLKVHPYPVKLALQQARTYSENRLRELLFRSIDADDAIKSGRLDKILAVERLLLSMSERTRVES